MDLYATIVIHNTTTNSKTIICKITKRHLLQEISFIFKSNQKTPQLNEVFFYYLILLLIVDIYFVSVNKTLPFASRYTSDVVPS